MTRLRNCLALALLCIAAAPALALESAPVVTPHAEVRLVSEVDAVAPGEPFRLGLHFRLAEGWHVYWINPGAAGEAPRLDLALPAGTTAGEFAWPTPLRLPDGPVMTYGYVDEVLLPLTVTPGAGELAVTAQASWLICEKICIPEEGAFRLDLPAGTPTASASAALFQAADARMPRPSPFAASVSPQGMLTVAGEGISPLAVRDAWFLPAAWGSIDDAAPQPLKVSDGSLSLAVQPGPAFDPQAGLAGTLVLADRTGAETYLSIAAPLGAAAPVAVAGDGLGLATLLGSAFLGGLILNLMPCVFPILAMKAIGLAGLAGRERSAVRAHAGSYVLGVLLGFAALGGLLIALRSAGMAAGWGFQFQSPVFVAATAWLLLAVGLNLSGVFEVGGRCAGIGGRLTTLGGHAGSLFTGLLVVVVATPCTAPFMGAAVAAAAVSPPATTMAIFAALGLGLAAPYGLLGLAPGLARLLPRPGAWMLTLKQALAFPMYGAAVWLAWVVSEQAGSTGVLVVLSGAVLVGLAAWLLGLTQQGGSRAGRTVAGSVAALSMVAAAALLATPASFADGPDRAVAGQGTDGQGTADGITPYSADRLAALRADGRPVFVNMTAAWCVTCIVNERVVLATDAVRQAFAERGVTYLKGDWTSADPAITEYLRARGRDGVPLYVYYPPAGDAVVLPQILTVDLVLAELDRS